MRFASSLFRNTQVEVLMRVGRFKADRLSKNESQIHHVELLNFDVIRKQLSPYLVRNESMVLHP